MTVTLAHNDETEQVILTVADDGCAATFADHGELKAGLGTRIVNGLVTQLNGIMKIRREGGMIRSEEHTSELQSLMRISYAVFCLKKKKNTIISNKINKNAC